MAQNKKHTNSESKQQKLNETNLNKAIPNHSCNNSQIIKPEIDNDINPTAIYSPKRDDQSGNNEWSRSASSSSMDFDNREHCQLLVNRVLSHDNTENKENKQQYNDNQDEEQKYNPNKTVFSANNLENMEPNDEDINTDKQCKRIIFLYNSKSGGQRALSLLRYFQCYTSLLYDLLKLNSSQDELNKLANNLMTYQDNIVVIIVGGDGSMVWASSLIHRAIKSVTKHIKFPIIVPFPVGTGNDLSRALGWGHIDRTPNKIIKHISDVEYCFNITKRFSLLDRWGITYSFPHIIEEWHKQKQISNENEEIKENGPFLNDIQSQQAMLDNYMNTAFSPPLPSHSLCYISFGYDAMITYNFAMERKNNPEKFKSQISNQAVYVRMGFKELVSPSTPLNDCIELEIDGNTVTNIPKNTRSLKLVNINSAANGIFFWGYKQSHKDELQIWKKPKLNDGLIEVMATRGSTDLAIAKTRLGHAHRLGQTNNVKITVLRTPTYLQIDGEGWLIDTKCTLYIKLYDQLPTLIGYKAPKGVYHKYEADYYTDKIKKARHRYRNMVRMKYNIPTKYSNKFLLKKQQSTDDFDLNMNGDRNNDKDDMKNDDENNIRRPRSISAGGKGLILPKLDEMRVNNDDNDGKQKKHQKWKLLFAKNKTASKNQHKDDMKSNNTKHTRKRSWF